MIDKIKYLIKLKNNNSDDFDDKYLPTKCNSDDNVLCCITCEICF